MTRGMRLRMSSLLDRNVFVLLVGHICLALNKTKIVFTSVSSYSKIYMCARKCACAGFHRNVNTCVQLLVQCSLVDSDCDVEYLLCISDYFSCVC